MYHGPCQAAIVWRRQAEEAYEVLRLACETAGLDSRAMTGVAELRGGVSSANRVFRVFYNMEKRGDQ